MNALESNPDADNEQAVEVSPESRQAYAAKLLLLTDIHKAIARKLNHKRRVNQEILHIGEDKFIPERGESLLDLWLDSERIDKGLLAIPVPNKDGLLPA